MNIGYERIRKSMKEADAYLDDNSILCKNHKKEREELARRRKEIDVLAKNGADLWRIKKGNEKISMN